MASGITPDTCFGFLLGVTYLFQQVHSQLLIGNLVLLERSLPYFDVLSTANGGGQE